RAPPIRGAVRDERRAAQRPQGHVRRQQTRQRNGLRRGISMRHHWLLLSVGLALTWVGAQHAAPLHAQGLKLRVDVVPHEDQRRVDVLVDGKPFTAYIYPTTLKKPTLYPLRTASGTVVTRGWPR